MFRTSPILAIAMMFSSLLTGCASAVTKPSPLDVPQQHGAFSGNLARVIGAIAFQFHVPMLAELTQPLPDDVQIAPGTHTARQLFDQLSSQNSGYAWEAHGNVVNFYDVALKSSPGDFFNVVINHFYTAGKFCDFQLIFPSLISNALRGRQDQGGIVTGMCTLGKLPDLPPTTMHHVSAREILLDATNKSGHFFVIVVFRTARARGEKDAEYAFANWFWEDIDNPLPIYLQPPPRTKSH